MNCVWANTGLDKLVVAQRQSPLFMEKRSLITVFIIACYLRPCLTFHNTQVYLWWWVVWASPSHSRMPGFRDCAFNMFSYPPCLKLVSCIRGRTMWCWQGIQMTWTFTSIFTYCKHRTTDPRLVNWAEATVFWDTNYFHSVSLIVYKLTQNNVLNTFLSIVIIIFRLRTLCYNSWAVNHFLRHW